MTVAAVCPTHGPQASGFLSITNSTGIKLENNRESCPVPGCRNMMRTMEGTFNFGRDVVEVITAPSWSVKALRAVASSAGEVVRLLGDTSLSDDEALLNARSLQPDLTRAVAALPNAAAADAMAEYLSATRPTNGAAPDRGKARKALVAICAFLIFYSDLRNGIVVAATDTESVVQFVIAHAQSLPDWFQRNVLPLLSLDDTKGHQP